MGPPLILSREISEGEFQEIEQVRRAIISLSSLEEHFGILVTAYSQLEKLLLCMLVNHLVGTADILRDSAAIDRSRREIAVSVMSLLSASRSYWDTLPQHLKAVERLRPGITDAVDSSRRAVFDSSSAMRIGEALRNHAQHAGVPLDSLTLSAKNIWKPGERSVSRGYITINPVISTASLIDNKVLRSKTRAELREMKGDHIDLKILLRGYVSGIAKSHYALRDFVDDLVPELSTRVDEIVARAAEALTPFSRLGLDLPSEVRVSPLTDGRATGAFFIGRELIDSLQRQRKLFASLEGLPRLSISSHADFRRDCVYLCSDGIWIE